MKTVLCYYDVRKWRVLANLVTYVVVSLCIIFMYDQGYLNINGLWNIYDCIISDIF